ncbi:MAG TPA: phosphoribosyltransferase family protein [Acidimicrobiia bacterium]|jgi:hypoxanthine phosphoribosyltransferase
MPLQTVLDPDGVRAAIASMAEEIERDHPDGVLLVGVLKGGVLLLADLARAIQSIPVDLELMAISRYQSGGGRVAITLDLAVDIRDRDVVIVDDIIDTGLTIAYLRGQLLARAPRSVSLCALVDRTSGRLVPERVRYRGVEVADEYLLGYGLHHRELYRNVNRVVAADRNALLADPGLYLADLYPARPA